MIATIRCHTPVNAYHEADVHSTRVIDERCNAKLRVVYTERDGLPDIVMTFGPCKDCKQPVDLEDAYDQLCAMPPEAA